MESFFTTRNHAIPLKYPSTLGQFDTNCIIFRNVENFPKNISSKSKKYCEGQIVNIFRNIPFSEIKISKINNYSSDMWVEMAKVLTTLVGSIV